MKLLLIGVLILSFLNSNAQSDCSAYFPYKQGTTMTYESFDKKGKLSQTEVHKVSSLQNTDTGIDATLDVKMTDKKGKDVIESSYDIECKDGVLYFDIRTMFNEEMMAPLANMDFTVEGDELVLPENLSVGQKLNDGSVTIKSSSGGIGIMNMTVNVTDREVIGKETVTTKAGTYECYKVSQKMSMKYIVNAQFSSVEYYAEGVGHVKSESYNKGGKLIGTRELVSISE